LAVRFTGIAVQLKGSKTMKTLEKLEALIYQGAKETERRIQETDRRIEETDRRIQETDRWIQEADRKFEKDRQERKEAEAELRKQMAGLTKSLGLFAESMVYPSVTRLFAERGINLTGIYSRSRERRNGSTMEVDVLGVGSEAVVDIEVKLRLETSDVKEFLKQLPQFFDFFPRFRGLKLYGAVAGMSIDSEVERFAYKQGLFVLAPSGDNMRILNDERFEPHIFSETGKKRMRRKS
jgi:hypothetical protein